MSADTPPAAAAQSDPHAWQTSARPAPQALASDAIHVWRVALDPLGRCRVEDLVQLLSADERNRADRFHFARDRRRFVARRAVLRTLLGTYLGLAPARLRFAYSARGEPRLAGQAGRELRFSVSHSQGLALYAFTRDRRIGVDVEAVRPVQGLEDIANRFFSAAEREELWGEPESRRLEVFLQLWTRKEAYLKALGVGLAGLDPAAAAGGDDGAEAAGGAWRIETLSPGKGYVAALAIDGAAAHLSRWTWPTENQPGGGAR